MSTLLQLYENVRAILIDEDGGDMSIAFGLKQPARQNNQGFGGANRIVFVPGQSGKLGKLGPPKRPGGNPRPLLAHYEAFTVQVWALDPTSEIACYQALMTLFNATCRALYLSGGARLTWGEPELVTKDIELKKGLELKLPMAIQSDIEDITFSTVIASMDVDNVLVGDPIAPHETPDGTDTHEPPP